MARAVRHNTSTRKQWLLAGLIDTATNYWRRGPPLDGGVDEDTDIGTDKTVPDDNDDDVASFICQQDTAMAQNL